MEPPLIWDDSIIRDRMNTQENPYSGLLGTLRQDVREQSSPAWRLGKVVRVSPLAIECGGIVLERDDLLVNVQLLPNAEEVELGEVMGTLAAGCDCDKGGRITELEVSGGTLAAAGMFGGVLTAGCRVAMLAQEDSGLFIVLCKVVTV